jgi:hypothetical protein
MHAARELVVAGGLMSYARPAWIAELQSAKEPEAIAARLLELERGTSWASVTENWAPQHNAWIWRVGASALLRCTCLRVLSVKFSRGIVCPYAQKHKRGFKAVVRQAPIYREHGSRISLRSIRATAPVFPRPSCLR